MFEHSLEPEPSEVLADEADDVLLGARADDALVDGGGRGDGGRLVGHG